MTCLGRHEALPEEVTVAVVSEDAQFNHQTDDTVRELDLPIPAVLRHLTADEHAALADADVAQADIAELGRTDRSGVLHHHRQQEVAVRMLQILPEPAQVLMRQGLPPLLLLGQLMDELYRVLRDVLLLHKPGAERGAPRTVIVPGNCGQVAVYQQIVEEVHEEGLRQLDARPHRLHHLGDILGEDLQTGVVVIVGLVLQHTLHVNIIYIRAITGYRLLNSRIAAVGVLRRPHIPPCSNLVVDVADDTGSSDVTLTAGPEPVEHVLLALQTSCLRVILRKPDVGCHAIMAPGWNEVRDLIMRKYPFLFGKHFFYVVCRS